MKKAIIIGAGIGGMTAALRLAAKGYSVQILEKNEWTGGKMRRCNYANCSFDMGPSLITMPFIIKELFADLGRDVRQYLHLLPIEPVCRYRWLDEKKNDEWLDCFGDAQKRFAAIEQWGGMQAARSVEKYLQKAGIVYHATKDVFLFNAFEGFKEFFKSKNLPLLKHLPSLRFTTRFNDYNATYFQDKRLLQLFNRFATYNGSSPYLAPATLMVIPYIEFEYGGWYPAGGIYSIAEALEKLCGELGVHIHKGMQVKALKQENAMVKAVQTIDGQWHQADIFVANGDVWQMQEKLLSRKQTILKPGLSTSGFVCLMPVHKKERNLAHHNILFSQDYQGEFQQLFKQGLPAEKDMTIYISASCMSDPGQAADGLENWFILVNTPPDGGQNKWTDTYKKRYFDKVLGRMEEFLPGISADIAAQPLLYSPDDFALDFDASGGSLYGSHSNSMFSAFLRPGNKDKKLRNLYYAGGSAHPGGGVPLVILSGSIAAALALQDHGY
jgi:phytoene desaturase